MYTIEEKPTKELYTYKVLESCIIVYKYIWAYTWEEGAKELEEQGYELQD